MMTALDTEALLAEYRETGDRSARNEVVVGHVDLARLTVRRFARGNRELSQDLQQVALTAVVYAAERFRPERGASFRTFANLTIEGELKRYLRDRSWIVRPPRARQENFLRMCRAQEELGHRLGRYPTRAEIARELDLGPEKVAESAQAGGARRPTPMETSDQRDAVSVRPELVSWDPGYGAFEAHDDLLRAIGALESRHRRVLHLRFIEELSQPEIARRLGLSQSYVSRLIQGALDTLRAQMAPPTRSCAPSPTST